MGSFFDLVNPLERPIAFNAEPIPEIWTAPKELFPLPVREPPGVMAPLRSLRRTTRFVLLVSEVPCVKRSGFKMKKDEKTHCHSTNPYITASNTP